MQNSVRRLGTVVLVVATLPACFHTYRASVGDVRAAIRPDRRWTEPIPSRRDDHRWILIRVRTKTACTVRPAAGALMPSPESKPTRRTTIAELARPSPADLADEVEFSGPPGRGLRAGGLVSLGSALVLLVPAAIFNRLATTHEPTGPLDPLGGVYRLTAVIGFVASGIAALAGAALFGVGEDRAAWAQAPVPRE